MLASALPVKQFAASLKTEGVVYLEEATGLFSRDEWQAIEACCFHDRLPLEKVYVGDADEPNDVEVGRFMTDVEGPQIVNHDIANRLLAILASERRIAFLEGLLRQGPLHLRRAQVNRMHKGSFIGLHLDRDSNPDYEIAIVLQMGQFFNGGEFVIHYPDGTTKEIVPAFRSATISRCDLPHEVLTVTEGTRTSLVFFVSPYEGPNRRLAAPVQAAMA